MKVDGERVYGSGRKRESTYLDKDLSVRFREFVKARPWLNTKSKTLAAAVEFYMYCAEKYGLDERHWPRIPIQEAPTESRPIEESPPDEWAAYSRAAQNYAERALLGRAEPRTSS